MAMRHFNTAGPVFPDQHYHVQRTKEIALLKEQVDAGRYVSAFAPRQTGKTTLLFDLRHILHQDPRYIFVALDFERYVALDSSSFYELLHKDLEYDVIKRLTEIDARESELVAVLFKKKTMQNHGDMFQLFLSLGELLADKRLALFVDEFDGISFDIAEPFLLTWRSIYIQRNTRPALKTYSVILAGIKNIAQWNPRRSTSPFNIADRLALGGFSEDEVCRLYAQFEEERGVRIDPQVFPVICRLTQGHPYLINRLGQKLEACLPNQTMFTAADVERIVAEEIVPEDNDHFASVKAHAAKHRDLLLKIIFGRSRVSYNLHHDDLADLAMYGLIAAGSDDETTIANPIDEQVILRQFAPVVNGEERYLFTMVNQYRAAGLPMEDLLRRFREFVWRAGTRLVAQYNGYKEAAGQYLLFSYLDFLVTELGGSIHMEMPSGRGRLDLLIERHGVKVVVETKMWYGPKYLEEGIAQVKRYMQAEKAQQGYVVVFDDTGVIEDGRIDELADGEHRIHVYYIAL